MSNELNIEGWPKSQDPWRRKFLAIADNWIHGKADSPYGPEQVLAVEITRQLQALEREMASAGKLIAGQAKIKATFDADMRVLLMALAYHIGDKPIILKGAQDQVVPVVVEGGDQGADPDESVKASSQIDERMATLEWAIKQAQSEKKTSLPGQDSILYLLNKKGKPPGLG